MAWTPPGDIDPEVLGVCTAVNALDGVETAESCCGHGARDVSVYLRVREPECLLPLLYVIDPCHGGPPGWHVRVFTGCAGTEVAWALDGPPGAYRAADLIAALLTAATRDQAA